MELSDLDCCGLREIAGVGDHLKAADVFLELVAHNAEPGNRNIFSCGGLIFSEAGGVASNYAAKFAALIRSRKLGKVSKLPEFRNPNTGNNIRAYIWIVDNRAVAAWIERHNEAIERYRDRRGWW